MANFLRINKCINGSFTYLVKHSQILRKVSSYTETAIECPCPDPCKTWDYNWDKLDSTKIEKRKVKYCHSKGKDGSIIRATRHLILIRTGQYSEDKLTGLGIKEVNSTADRLAKMKDIPWSAAKIYSDSGVYFETAKLINDKLKITEEIKAEVDLNVLPCIDPNPLFDENILPLTRYENCAKAEAVFRTYFHRKSSDEKGDQDSHTVLVGSEFLLSYLICRALQFPPEVWGRINSTGFGSMTWIAIPPTGFVYVNFFGENGYMPANEIKFFNNNRNNRMRIKES